MRLKAKDEGRTWKDEEKTLSFILHPSSLNMRTLVLGLGNPLLGDDGVGWRIAEECASRVETLHATSLQAPHVEIDCFARGGLSLMERLIGYDRAILIDAIHTGRKPVGTVDCFRLAELQNPNAGHLASAHDATLQTALEMGRVLGARLPATVMVVAIEAENVYDFSEELSPAVAASTPRAVETVMQLLQHSFQEEHDDLA